MPDLPALDEVLEGTWSERFELVRKLGEGGFAIVFEATPKGETEGERVALKVLLKTMDPVSLDRLRKEISSLQQLDHPNIVSALETDGTMQWYTMPLADGDLWRRAPELDPCERYDVISSVTRALVAAHEKKLLHRDVSPGNILRFSDGEAGWKLADFGLVRRFPGHTTQVVTSGRGIGTLLFAAPEMEINPHHVDERVDVFSLGQVIGWLVSGKKPRPQDTTVLSNGPWRDLVARMTARSLDDRPRTIAEVLEELPPIERRLRDANRTAWNSGSTSEPVPAATPFPNEAVAIVVRHIYSEGSEREFSLLGETKLGLTRLGIRMAIEQARKDGLLEEVEAENDHGETWNELVVTEKGRAAVIATLSDSDIFKRAAPSGNDDEIPF